jgi:hypothetical protein
MIRRAAVAAALVATLAAGAAAAEPTEARIAELMVASGIDKQLDSYPDTVRLSLQQGRAQSPTSDAQYQLLMDAVAQAYDPPAMKQTIARRLRKDLTAADVDGALAWLRAPLGRKVTRLEEEHSTAEAMQAMQAWAQSLKVPPAATRMDLVHRFDQAVGITEFTVASMKHSQLAMVAALTAGQPPAQQRQAFDKVSEVFEQKHDELLRMAGQQVIPFMLYCYRSLSDAELEQYIAYALSPGGKRYHEASKAAFDEAVVRASHDAGAVFGEALRKHKGGA